ncbi:MAG: DEAD/DEAH box helicase, partial [Selenomonadaceae bacterium]|nr:DEAD/DEAH box helicase [Selenomonadaceae bacterium]
MTIDELLIKYRDENISERDKGAKFERLMKNFLMTNPVYRGKFSDVWLWNEFPFRDELGTVDLGIDIVCKAVDGEFWAVQCKFYAETSTIDKAAVDTFLATSSKTFDGDKKFSARLWISTSDNLTDNAEITLQNQSPPVARIGMEELRKAAVDWEKLDAGTFGKEAVKNFREPLQHQLNAINAAQNHFQNYNRGKLIMACGTGKTYTSLKIAETLAPNGKILFLVPSISLLGQILYEWATFAEKPFNYICVCSDETVSKKTDDEILKVNLPLPATTNPDEISFRLSAFSCQDMTVIFSTYQSLDKVAAAKIDFDLIICDEAHRTTGYGKDATAFTQVHDQNFIRGKKRIYMTATPRLYTSEAKKKAAVNDLMLWSMDDAEIYGDEFFHLGFGDAVEKNLLSDYKVLILTVNKPLEVGDKKISTDDKEKVTGCINALQKKLTDIEILGDPAPMKTAVGFCSRIKDSENIAEEFKSQGISAVHVDGKMSSKIRSDKLDWLKNTPDNDCRIITNARCLSEGVDVPSLDAILFLSSRRSQVDIVQAVGRVMRKADDKKYGYIIIPVVVPLDKSPEEALAKGEFDIVWKILNALRAHDSRMDIFIEEIKLHSGNGGGKNPSDKIFVENPDQIALQTLLHFDELKNLIYARMVERVGNRRYWEQWAKDIAQIAERHIQRIKDLISVEGIHQREFGNFVYDLQKNLNPSVTPAEAVEMLAHHLISRPVFDALFENYSFVKSNPVSRSLEKILKVLETQDTAADSAQLEKFYQSVRERCKIASTAEDRQKIIIELYEKFFKTAAPMTVERLGIVYTPVEVVDFILRSVDAVLKKNFNRSLSDKNVHVLDPFTGTGTFITRLIQSGLIKKKDLLRKYFRELHANEIVLLAYYIAAVNIENAFFDRNKELGTGNEKELDTSSRFLYSYVPFEGICFTDTFELYERGEIPLNLAGVMKENSERVNEQKNSRIEIIVGNPPYSVGQRSANDNNQNQTYSNLEDRIAATYAAKTDATNKNSLYDSYIKAVRWASDRNSEG